MDGFFMNETSPANQNPRWIACFVSGLLALVLGFILFTPEQSIAIVIYGGYWWMLALSALFAWHLILIAREFRPASVDFRQHLLAWPTVLLIACGLLLLVHERYGFKILMDEVMLLGTSMSLHYDKTALVPMRGHDIQGAFQLLAGQLDKRPLFQPFLVSLLHDLTGYRPANAFVLNTILTFVLLTLVWFTGKRIAGRGAGAVGVLLFTSLPLLAQNTTGGGFEILNLVMILATLLLGMRYVERRDAITLNALCLSGVLLALTRYESVVFLLPVAGVILWTWYARRQSGLTWLAALTPLMLVPYALHNQVFAARQSSWELMSQPGYEKPFSLSYAPDNIAHALNFFFNTNGEQSNSLVLAALGLPAAFFFALWTLKSLRALRVTPPERVALAIFALGFAAHTALLMCYFWGKFDDPVIRRLSLPLNLFLVIGVLVVAAEISRANLVWRTLAGIVGAGFFLHSLPAMARHDYSLDYYVGREMEWRRDFIAAHSARDYLVIDNNSIMWITHQVSATPVLQALQRKEIILYNQRNRTFSDIYVFQRLSIDPATSHTSFLPDEDLGPDYQLETVWERRFTPLTVSRISRVVSIREGPLAPPARPAAGAMDRLTPAEREKVRQQYLDNFIKRLP
jgi:hypothetical protein